MANPLQRFRDTLPDEKSASEDRLVMLCDGIFAIAVTLLVLDIRLPIDTVHFRANLPTFFTKILYYFVTFLIIARYWMVHRRIMYMINKLDSVFLWLTFLFLAFIALLPATIIVISEFGKDLIADIIYTVSLAACGLSASALWIYASSHHRLIAPSIDQHFITFRTIDTLVAPIYFLLSLLLFFVPLFANDPPLIFYSWIFTSVPSSLLQRYYSRLYNATPATTPAHDQPTVDH